MTSRQPRDALGGRAELSAGEIGTLRLSLRHAGALGERSFYRAHVSAGRTRDFYQSRVGGGEYPGLPAEVRPLVRDQTTQVTAGARVDRHLASGDCLTVEGGWAFTEGGVLVTSAGRIQNTGVDRPWVRSSFETPRMSFAGYFDGRYGQMESLSAAAPSTTRRCG